MHSKRGISTWWPPIFLVIAALIFAFKHRRAPAPVPSQNVTNLAAAAQSPQTGEIASPPAPIVTAATGGTNLNGPTNLSAQIMAAADSLSRNKDAATVK